MKKTVALFMVMATLLFATIIFAAPTNTPMLTEEASDAEELPTAVAEVNITASQISWIPYLHENSAGQVLTVAGPNGLYWRQEVANGIDMNLAVRDTAEQVLPDGLYSYELYTVPLLTAAQQEAMATRDGDAQVSPEPRRQSGHFQVLAGEFVLPTLVEEEEMVSGAENTAVNTSPSTTTDNNAPMDVVVADDQIVQGSLCVGLDCINNESFGFDTIRLKENNTRIAFQDTSSVPGSFASVDWQLTANESGSGGVDKFSIEDVTNARIPFTIIANAPTNSLYINSSGLVGIGTSTPVVEAHISNGDSPAVRLEQNASSGFQAQTWDIAANETNFFVRDVTNGSRLPFKIKPGAPTNSLFIAANGDVGLGTQSPSAAMHMVNNDGDTQIFVQENNTTPASYSGLACQDSFWSNFKVGFLL